MIGLRFVYDSRGNQTKTKTKTKPKLVVVVIEEFLIEEFLIEEFNRLILCSGSISVYLGSISVYLGSISERFGSISYPPTKFVLPYEFTLYKFRSDFKAINLLDDK